MEDRGEVIRIELPVTEYSPEYWLHPDDPPTVPLVAKRTEMLDPGTRSFPMREDRFQSVPVNLSSLPCKEENGAQAVRTDSPAHNTKENKIFLI